MKPGFLSFVLFWLTVLAGTAILAPCLLLPAWLERQAQAEYLQAQEAYVASLRTHLESVQKQIEHINHDPAYVARLAQQEFGAVFKMPNVETILIEPGASPAADATSVQPPTDAPPEDPLLPELSTFIHDVMRRYPNARLFVDARTRPTLMMVGGALLLAGIVLVGLMGGSGTAHAQRALANDAPQTTSARSPHC